MGANSAAGRPARLGARPLTVIACHFLLASGASGPPCVTGSTALDQSALLLSDQRSVQRACGHHWARGRFGARLRQVRQGSLRRNPSQISNVCVDFLL